MSRLAPEIEAYHALGSEASRLGKGCFPLEKARTQELIARHLPLAPQAVPDVGGGAGAHALWLAAEGHEVHLIDPIELHVGQVLDASRGQPRHPLASASVGEARRIDEPDASFDAVLLLGPLAPRDFD